MTNRIIANGVAHEFEELPPEKRPQDPRGDARGWTGRVVDSTTPASRS
jgi:hypothetical protein